MLVAGMIAGLVLLTAATVPVWPYSRAWGYTPAKGIGVMLVMVVALKLMHVI